MARPWVDVRRYSDGQSIDAATLNIPIDDVDMIITKVTRSKHKSKVPESPKKTII